MKHYKIFVEGEVQGVFYRSSTKNKAKEWGITGFAENKGDGSVYIEAEGDEDSLKKLVQWCEEGPDTAKVKNVEYQEGDIRKFNFFEIR